MRRAVILTVAVVVGIACSRASRADDAPQPSFAKQLDAWLPDMGATKIADRQKSQQALQAALTELGTPGREAELAKACNAVAARLGPETAKPARIWMLRQLEFNGRAECVAALAACLEDDDAEVRDCARRALANNPAPEANAALLAALASPASDSQRVAIVNSLGYRKDPASVPSLAKLLGSPDPALVGAAAGALGKIGGAEAAAALRKALAKARGATRAALADACLRSADQFLANGKKAEAAAIYAELDTPEFDRTIRLAALEGKLDAAGDEAGKMVIELVADADADRRAIAAGAVEKLHDAGVIASLTDAYAGLPVSGRVLLLGALAARGDKTALPLALAAAQSDDEQLRLAGVEALDRIGDARAVPLLIRMLASGGPLSDPALTSLRTVFGDGVDEAIIAAMQKADPPLRQTLIDLVRERGAVSAVPALLAEARHSDAGVRDRAIRALGDLAEPKDIPAMIAILLATERGRRRDDVEKAIARVADRIEEPDHPANGARRAAPVLAAIAGAGPEGRLVLLSLLGRIGGRGALAEVRTAIASNDPQVKEAGVRALCNWPDASVADELLDLAQHAPNESHATWALRAYIRVVSLPDETSYKKMLARLKKAMELAGRDDERRLVVSRASSARDIETLRWLVPLVDDPVVSQQACRSIVELAHHRELMGPNQAEFRAALNKVIATTKDQGLIDRAKAYMTGL